MHPPSKKKKGEKKGIDVLKQKVHNVVSGQVLYRPSSHGWVYFWSPLLIIPLSCCCSPDLMLFPCPVAVPLTSCCSPVLLLFPWSHAVPMSCCCSPDFMLFPCPVAVPLISRCSPVLLLFPWPHARAYTHAQTRKHLRWKWKSWCERHWTNCWKSKTGFDWRLERPITFKLSSTWRVTWTVNRLCLVTRLADHVSSSFWYDLCECLGAKCQESTNQPFLDFQFHRCLPSNDIISSCLGLCVCVCVCVCLLTKG